MNLMAIFGADATPFINETKKVVDISKKAGKEIRVSLEGGHGEIKSGVVREAIVLLREISAGNWTRVPGSLSLLLQRMGVLKILFGEVSLTTLGFGTALGVVGVAAVGAAIGIGIFMARVNALKTALEGLKVADFNPTYIPKIKQAMNAALEGQRAINREVARTIELYNSVEAKASRAAEATKEKYTHERKMNEFERDPVKKAARGLEIDRKEKEEELRNKANEQIALRDESERKKKASDSILVPSKEHDANIVANTEAQAKEAQEFLKNHQQFGTLGDKAKAALLGGIIPANARATYDAMGGADRSRVDEATSRIRAHREAVDRAAENDETRKRKDQLQKDAEESAKKSAQIGAELPELGAKASLELANKKKEQDAELDSKRKFEHAPVNELQRIGAYTPAAVEVNIARQSLGHLASIDRKIGAKGTGEANLGKVGY